LSNFLFGGLWPGLLIWTLLYISDYRLTIICARLYRAGANEKVVFEGSYELNPFFQKDIDTLKALSPRFVFVLLFAASLMTFVWYLTRDSVPQMYEFLLGALILIQLTVHLRHLRNFFTFRAMRNSNDVRGRIEYSRPFILRMSFSELLLFSGFYLVLFAFLQQWFFLGGAAGCLSAGIRHRKYARKAILNQTTSLQSPHQTSP
jgi:hypothetical protein